MGYSNLAARPRSRGFSLLEIMVALVVVALVISASLVLLTPTRENSRAAGFVRDLEIVVASVRQGYQPYGRYVTGSAVALSTATAVAEGLIPKHLVASSTALRDPWGRAFTIGSWPTSGAAASMHTQFVLSLQRPGEDACSALATALMRMSPASFTLVSPSNVAILTEAIRPGPASFSGLVSSACQDNSPTGVGAWQVVFD